MNIQNFSNEQIEKLKFFLLDYLQGLLEGEGRRRKGNIECGFDEDEVYCVTLTERMPSDPRILKGGQVHDWKSEEDYTDHGRIIIMYVADWEGTLVSVAIPLPSEEK